MKTELEPMQQPVRKIVGRPADASNRLSQVEDLNSFLNKYAHGALSKSERDYFPLRKVVGRRRNREK
jgi:hypothetical protein